MLETAFIILVFAIIFVLGLRRKGDFKPPKTTPSDARTYGAFERVDSLFVNRSELAFFHALNRELPAGFHLQSKTRLEDIVGVKRSIHGEIRWKLRARVKSRHVDYLIIDDDGIPRIAIELDGSSHNTDAVNADQLKDGIFEAVGLPLLRIKTGDNFPKTAQKIMTGLTRP